ncbi:MAG: M48 family metalloprotease, partial [Hyphomonadaceae bacterium]
HTLVAENVFRGLMQGGISSGRSQRRSSSSESDSPGRSGGGAFLVAIVVALVLIALAYALAIVIRFSLSRRREFLADAGSVELTKNPDALISALRKISGNAALPNAPAEVREMFIENEHARFSGIFDTHPPIEKRIEALMRYAGGRDSAPTPAAPSGPWGSLPA